MNFKQLLSNKFTGRNNLFARFRKINIALFAIVTIIIFTVMFFILEDITDIVSKDYAQLYAENAVGTLNTYLNGEIALITKAAKSSAIIDWFEDEENQEKKLHAYEEMMGTIEVSSSQNLYIGIEKSLHEFSIEKDITVDNIKHFATLSKENPDDIWYFECVANNKDYLLNVDIDKAYERKRVWLNYKVSRGGNVYGVLCTGLEFSKVVENLFSKYNEKSVRGLIIDEKGIIQMDSSLVGNERFLYVLDVGRKISDEFTDPTLLEGIKEYTKNMEGYYSTDSITTVLKLSNQKYRYATIAPIASTTWSVITLYNSSALFDVAKLVPMIVTILIIFIIFIFAINRTISIFILSPFKSLVNSVESIKTNLNEQVYGTNREDEIGELANTIQSMKDNLIDAIGKVHYDSLTGIYNRRYLNENLEPIIKLLSRSNGIISVLMLDVDYFKKYNDTYGHNIGDECLITIATILSSSIERAGDFVARYGGEEFIIILPNTDEEGACTVAKKILIAVKNCVVPHIKNEVESHVTISIGITTGVADYTAQGENYFKRADEALYMSKQSGRNKYTFLSYETNKEAE